MSILYCCLVSPLSGVGSFHIEDQNGLFFFVLGLCYRHPHTLRGLRAPKRRFHDQKGRAEHQVQQGACSLVSSCTLTLTFARALAAQDGNHVVVKAAGEEILGEYQQITGAAIVSQVCE